jgi:hypothetical protein
MTDRLDAIAAGLRDGRYDCRVPGDTDDVRWLVAEVRRLRGELQDERLSLAPLREAHAEALNAAAQNEAALAALRERHAQAVKSAYLCGLHEAFTSPSADPEQCWQLSAARRGLAEKGMP